MTSPTHQDRATSLDAIRDQWLALGTSTSDTLQRERDCCEWDVRDAIEASGTKTHSFLSFWVPSPMKGVLAAASLRSGMGKPMGEQLSKHLAAGLNRTSPGAQGVRREVDEAVRRAGDAVLARLAADLDARGREWEQLAYEMGNVAWNEVWNEIGDPVYTNCGYGTSAAESSSKLDGHLAHWAEDIMAGQFAAGAMAHLDALHLEGVAGTADGADYEPLRKIAGQCSWWWATGSTAVLCEHPQRFEVSGKHVTVEYRDGWTVRV